MDRRKVIAMLVLSCVFIFSGCGKIENSPTETSVAAKTVDILESPLYAEAYLDISEPSENSFYDEDEVFLLALLVQAEAEDEPELGKKLVVDTVLNRIDSKSFPNTVEEVIFQPYQYPSMVNGRSAVCDVDDYTRKLVVDELSNRTDYECIFFNSEGFVDWSEPMFKVGNHYFSKGEDNQYE